MIKDKLFFFKKLTLTTFYGDAICRGLGLRGVQLRRAKEEWCGARKWKNGDRLHFPDVL